ncbi:MAG: hypothetical protein J6Y28_07600 [Acholeplasmatales bacterium]|nr:hypothetical protein [Acholeplasmatales bacterium]
MTALSKLKYFIATIVFLVICVLTTAYQAKVNTDVEDVKIIINFTYAALFLACFLFGGVVAGISGVVGVCFYILLKNQSAWLALLGLVVGLVFGIITKLTSYLISKNKLDKRALLISAGVFFIALGAIFTTASICFPEGFYIVKNTEVFVRFYWVEYVLPYIIGVIFIASAILINKMKENLSEMVCISAFTSSSLIVCYGLVSFLCSIKKISFSRILANTYNNYFQNFYISLCIGLLIAMALFVIGYIVIELRRTVKTMLKDAE